MNVKNYQLFCDELCYNNKKNGIKPKLLLQVCCAPCSSAVLERIEDSFEITAYFYNPNITDKTEYDKRLLELDNFLKVAHKSINLIDGGFSNSAFYDYSKGFENEKEGGLRCKKCYFQRLNNTSLLAKNEGYDYFCTTLSVSPYKNSLWLNEIGEELQNQNGIKYLFSDFKKHEGYKRSIELSKIYNLYRQNYCGCEFSKMERDAKIELKI